MHSQHELFDAGHLTLPSSGRLPASFACFQPPLMSNVRRQCSSHFNESIRTCNAMRPTSRSVLALKFAMLFVASFLLAMVTYQLALLLPGQVKTTHWQTLASVSFIAAGFAAVWLLWRTRLGLGGKTVLSLLLVLAFLFFAFSFSLRSRCGDESLFIGAPERPVKVASCG
jgi:hypothetical protein